MADLIMNQSEQAEAAYLTAESSEAQLKAYFNGLLTIAQSQTTDFPVNLDDVWRLVYSRKDKAVSTLKRMFIQNVDYQLIPQKVEQVSGAKHVDNYFLSLSCLEFFVARKVRAVFDVYRKVFHKAIRYAAPEESPILSARPTKETEVVDVIEWIAALQQYAGVGQATTLEIMDKYAKEKGLPMPDYVEAEDPQRTGLYSLSNCLEYWKVGCSSTYFNRTLMEMGYLTERTAAPRRKGGERKTYKVIVGDGLLFGENKIPSAYPNITQPLWYLEKFGDLLGRVRKAGLFEPKK